MPAALQRLYGLLRLQHNFFRPVRKLLSKRRDGSKARKRYDWAQAPYQRVLAAGYSQSSGKPRPGSLRHWIRSTARSTSDKWDVVWKLTRHSSLLAGGYPWATEFRGIELVARYHRF